jgi:hypothetical protein
MIMAIKTNFQVLFFLFIGSFLSAQQLIVANGGVFGSSTEFANIGIYNSSDGSYRQLDTVRTNSVQDVLVEENRFIYLAAQDSIVKYDLWTGERIAAGQFGAPSTIRLGIYGEKLIVGNWYAASEGNLRIFDKNSLAFIDSIPEITKGATDFLVIANKAYIAQNHTTLNYSDTLGYMAIVDLDNLSFLRNDTLSTVGDEIGRLVNVGDSVIYSINGVSSTISTLHLLSGVKNTVAAAAVLYPKSTGKSVFFDGTKWYLPFNNGIGTYDLVNNTIINADIVVPPTFAYGFAVDPIHNKIYISTIDFGNQQSNQGLIYNLNGDSIGIFPVGFSPEVLEVLNSTVNLNNSVLEDFNPVTIFPNPIVNELNMLHSDKIGRLEIIGLDSKVLKRFEGIENNSFKVDLSSLSSGVYFVRIGTKIQKFVKI